MEGSGIPGFLVSSELEDGSQGFYCGDFWCKSMASEPVVSEMQAEKQVGEMMQNIKIQDSAQAPALEANANIAKEAPGPEGSPSDATSSVTSLGDSTSTKDSELEQETVVENGLYYPPNNYYGFYYPGYEVVGNEWDEQGAYLGMDGLEIPYTGIQAENGHLLYYMPGYGYPQPLIILIMHTILVLCLGLMVFLLISHIIPVLSTNNPSLLQPIFSLL